MRSTNVLDVPPVVEPAADPLEGGVLVGVDMLPAVEDEPSKWRERLLAGFHT